MAFFRVGANAFGSTAGLLWSREPKLSEPIVDGGCVVVDLFVLMVLFVLVVFAKLSAVPLPKELPHPPAKGIEAAICCARG